MPARKKKAAPKVLTFRATLRVIDRVLAKSDQHAKKLWAVLTALRGPDENSGIAKDMGTVPIRYTAFPRTARREGFGNSLATFARVERPEQKSIVALDQQLSYHFRYHIEDAARALGLTTRSAPEFDALGTLRK